MSRSRATSGSSPPSRLTVLNLPSSCLTQDEPPTTELSIALPHHDHDPSISGIKFITSAQKPGPVLLLFTIVHLYVRVCGTGVGVLLL